MQEGGDAVPQFGRHAATCSSPRASRTAPQAIAKAALSVTADSKTKMQSAQDFVDRKEYATAEQIYKQVVASEPNNAEALKALASVLYRQDKIDESAAILDKLPKN